MERRASRNGTERDHFTRKTRKHTRLKDSSRVKRNARRRERHEARREVRDF
jgi:hypothetical protein